MTSLSAYINTSCWMLKVWYVFFGWSLLRTKAIISLCQLISLLFWFDFLAHSQTSGFSGWKGRIPHDSICHD
ncbi:hypothetical protein ACB092_06G106500 [Castanea dentata]